jgi:hypothetical protein
MAREEMVLVAVDVTATNSKAAASIQSWLRSKEQQTRLLAYLNTQDTGLRVLELQVGVCYGCGGGGCCWWLLLVAAAGGGGNDGGGDWLDRTVSLLTYSVAYSVPLLLPFP